MPEEFLKKFSEKCQLSFVKKLLGIAQYIAWKIPVEVYWKIPGKKAGEIFKKQSIKVSEGTSKGIPEKIFKGVPKKLTWRPRQHTIAYDIE